MTIYKILGPKTTYIFLKMEDDLNFWGNGRRPQFFGEIEDAHIKKKMEDDLKCFR